MTPQELLEEWKKLPAARAVMEQEVKDGQESAIRLMQHDIYNLYWFLGKLLERSASDAQRVANTPSNVY